MLRKTSMKGTKTTPVARRPVRPLIARRRLIFLQPKPRREMAEKAHLVHLEDVEPEIAAADSAHAKSKWYGLLGDNVSSKRISLACVEVEPGGGTAPHSHDNMEQAFYFMKGKGVMMVDGKEYGVRPGTAVHVPLNAIHSYRNTGRSPLFFLVIEPRPYSKKWIQKP